MKLDELKPNPKNPRKISDGRLAMLKESLLFHGDLSGIVYNYKSGQLVGGHQRSKVFEGGEVHVTKTYDKPTKTGTVEVGYILYNGERYSYRGVKWSKHHEMAANIAANKQAGDWDLPELGLWMKELGSFDVDFDLDLTMFDENERKELIPENSKEGLCDADDVPQQRSTSIKRGDLYLLGDNHRLLCGDSTVKEEVDRLMNGEKAEICFTSPPYNLGDNAKLRGHNGDGDDTVYNEKSDHKTQLEYLEFMSEWTRIAIENCQYVFCNIQILAGNKLAIPAYWMNFKDRLVDIMIWDKEHASPSMAARVLNSVWEFIFIFIFANENQPKRSIKTGKSWRGTIDNIYRLNPNKGPRDKEPSHGAVFPVAFAAHFISNFGGELVYEPFCGSGSTLIACEKTNRKCYGMEIDPSYCQVIIDRWEKFTGKKAVKVKTVVRKKK